MLKGKLRASSGKLAALLLGVAVVLVGCHKVTGGGWLAGLYGGKANFGFEARCVTTNGNENRFYEGQFQYQDRSAGVGFHGDIDTGFTATWANNCEDAAIPLSTLNEAQLTGTCISQPGGVSGSFSVRVVDNGSPGSLAGDTIVIDTPSQQPFYSGEYAGIPCTDNGVAYHNEGSLGGGNIVSHGHTEQGSAKEDKG